VGFDTEGSEDTKTGESIIHDNGILTLAEQIIGLGFKVDRRLGPRLLERIYADWLCWQVRNSGLQVLLP